MTVRSLLAGPAAAAAVVATALPAHAAAATTFRQHDSFDPTGAVFACTPTDLTVTGGVVKERVHGVQLASGRVHFAGTIVPHDVTLTDGTSAYTLSGAAHFSAKAPSRDAMPTVSTETQHFVIRNASGGVYAKVQVVIHANRHGKTFTFDRGTCEEPQD